MDDISGWDFYKNDNNPYDDTRYGHGTGEAEDSSDEANNGQGDIGVCPDCRFMMLRAGDSFIADATDFAKGVVYAADNGVKVVQEALGTINQTAFSKAAIDYAYAHGTAVIASMADENSRHHNMPGVTNHTLPVHAITNDSTAPGSFRTAWSAPTPPRSSLSTRARNYGGQNMLSVSGTSCSSEATGKGAGLAALIFSEGLNQQLDLSAEEVMQLMKMNADLIDVPQSTSSNPDVADQFYESLPYFSQRFGYGRPNMLRTMQAIDDKMIPPEVDLISPAWFETLYADRTTSPVPVLGRIAASRAPSYDYIVEWAPGVEPADSAFQPLSNWVRNINGTTATGGPDMPLTTLVPGQLNTTHVPDPDSRKFGENDRTITLRVRAIAHYAGGDVQGQARRTLAIVNALPTLPLDAGITLPDATPTTQGGIVPETTTHNGLDPDLLTGFPIDMGASVETSPKLIDIDGDGVRDIVAGASDGSMHVFSLKSGSPVELPGFPYHTAVIDGLNPNLGSEPTIPSYLNAPAYKGGGVSPAIARESIVGSPAVGDVNSDGKNDIVFSTWQGSVYAVGSNGQALPGWPKRLPIIPSCPQPQTPSMSSTPPCMDTGHKWSRGAYASPVLADFDGNHSLEIVQAAFDGNIYVWHGDGTALAGWPVAIHGPNVNSANRIMTTPAVADFNGDGIPDLATGSNEEIGAGGGAGNYFIVDGRGMNAPGGPYLPHWPISMVSLHIFPVVAEGTDSSPAIADFTGSGQPEVLFQGNGAPPFILPGDPGEQHFPSDPPNRLPVYESDAGRQVGLDPTSLFGPGTKAFFPDTMFPLFSHPSVGDLGWRRRARHHHDGGQPESRRKPRGRSPWRRRPGSGGDVERRDRPHVLRLSRPHRGFHVPDQRSDRRHHRRRLSRGAPRHRRVLRARLRRVRVRGQEVAEVHRQLAHRHTRRGRHRRRPHDRGRDRHPRRIPVRLAHQRYRHRRHPVGVLPPRQRQHRKLRPQARPGRAAGGDQAARLLPRLRGRSGTDHLRLCRRRVRLPRCHGRGRARGRLHAGPGPGPFGFTGRAGAARAQSPAATLKPALQRGPRRRYCAPPAGVAQMVRAGVSYALGRGFDSLLRHPLPASPSEAKVG